MRTWIATALAMALLLDGVAFATDFLHQASLLSLKSSPVRQKLRFVARVPPVRSPSADPMRVGASLEIVNPISGEAATFDLLPAGWSTLAATGFYRFVNPAAPAGISSVRFAVIRSGSSIQVVARATGITLDEPAQGTLGVILTVGSDRYCSTCNAPSRDESGRFVANKCAVPVACVRPPSSSTGTSSTTTSTASSTPTTLPVTTTTSTTTTTTMPPPNTTTSPSTTTTTRPPTTPTTKLPPPTNLPAQAPTCSM